LTQDERREEQFQISKRDFHEHIKENETLQFAHDIKPVLRAFLRLLLIVALFIFGAQMLGSTTYLQREQFYCKLVASNDAFSQGVCGLDFERRFPPQ